MWSEEFKKQQELKSCLFPSSTRFQVTVENLSKMSCNYGESLVLFFREVMEPLPREL